MKRRLQVFISSTFTDLMVERQAAVSAVLKSGHIPAGMELFSSGDRSQMTTIRQWIDESDVYMIILGGRWGSIEPSSRISYTELEYDYAVERCIPLFAVVINEAALEAKIRAGGTAFTEKEHPKELALSRSKVLSNVSSFFDDPKDIRLCVHESLSDMALNRDLKGWVSGDEIVDTKPLFEEIRKLSEENHQLRKILTEQEKRSAMKTDGKVSLRELMVVLAAINVKVPSAISGGDTEVEVTLLGHFYFHKETYLTGVTNSAGSGKRAIRFFYDMCPRLQVHGLLVNEKVDGAHFRRYSITPLGIELLAYMEREIVLNPVSEKV